MTTHPKLKIIRSMAEVKIRKLVEEGQHLARRLSEVQSIRTAADFQKAHEEYGIWCIECDSRLMESFEGDSLAIQYRSLHMKPVRVDQSFLENKRSLLYGVEQRVLWLEGLVARLDTFAESDMTITGGFR